MFDIDVPLNTLTSTTLKAAIAKVVEGSSPPTSALCISYSEKLYEFRYKQANLYLLLKLHRHFDLNHNDTLLFYEIVFELIPVLCQVIFLSIKTSKLSLGLNALHCQ